MKAARKQRLFLLILLVLGISGAVTIVLFTLRRNIDLYVTPSQLLSQSTATSQWIRLGGVVVRGSVHHQPNCLQVNFQVTDNQRQVRVFYRGVLPSLFREGQTIIAEGHLDSRGLFIATQVLAKHDERYHPLYHHSERHA